MFQAVVSLRTDSVDLARVGGVNESGAVDDTGLAQRRYLIEAARFGAGGEAAYRDHERAADMLMAPHGYHVERVTGSTPTHATPTSRARATPRRSPSRSGSSPGRTIPQETDR